MNLDDETMGGEQPATGTGYQFEVDGIRFSRFHVGTMTMFVGCRKNLKSDVPGADNPGGWIISATIEKCGDMCNCTIRKNGKIVAHLGVAAGLNLATFMCWGAIKQLVCRIARNRKKKGSKMGGRIFTAPATLDELSHGHTGEILVDPELAPCPCMNKE